MFFILVIALAAAGVVFGETKEYTCENGLYVFNVKDPNRSQEKKRLAHWDCVDQYAKKLQVTADNLRYVQIKNLDQKSESAPFHPGNYKCKFGAVLWTTKPGGIGAMKRQSQAIHDCWRQQRDTIDVFQKEGIVW